jgi:lipopolysaccharide export LptBFGC system permease protein LptF
MVRQELGQDVNAACGQLVVEKQCQDDDIEDLQQQTAASTSFKGKAKITQRRRPLADGIIRVEGSSPAQQQQNQSNQQRKAILFLLCILMVVLAVRVAVKSIKYT